MLRIKIKPKISSSALCRRYFWPYKTLKDVWAQTNKFGPTTVAGSLCSHAFNCLVWISLGLSIVLPQLLELYEQVLPFPSPSLTGLELWKLEAPVVPATAAIERPSVEFLRHSLRNSSFYQPSLRQGDFLVVAMVGKNQNLFYLR